MSIDKPNKDTTDMKNKKERTLVSFDWAIKKILRSKVNFDVLEGFLSELLKSDITIENILESESNREYKENKLTRVDLMVHNEDGQRIIIEVQYEREPDYFHRMLFGTSKAIVENLRAGQEYGKTLQVISIHIVFFDLGQGDDYIYVGKTDFTGMHKKDNLTLSNYQKSLFPVDEVSEIFPTYYLLKVNTFNDVAKDGLDEWMYFLKNEEIKPGSTAKGLKSAKQKLSLLKLSKQDRLDYDYYQEELRLTTSLVEYSIKESERRQKVLEKTQTLLVSATEQANIERQQKEEAQKREEEAQMQKEALAETAITALTASGMSLEEAKKLLGLGK